MTSDSSVFLVGLDDVRSYLDIDDSDSNDLLGYLMQGISAMFNAATGRELLAADHVEYRTGDGTGTIYVRNPPINSTSETIDVRVDADRNFPESTKISDIWIDGSIGHVVRINGAFERTRPVRIEYNGGYESVPYDLRMAALTMVTIAWKERSQKQMDVASMSKGEITYQYLDRLPHKVRMTLQRYSLYG